MVISPILSRYVTVTMATINEISIKFLGKCQTGRTKKQALNTGNGGLFLSPYIYAKKDKVKILACQKNLCTWFVLDHIDI